MTCEYATPHSASGINRNPFISAEMKQFREQFKALSGVSFSMNTLLVSMKKTFKKTLYLSLYSLAWLNIIPNGIMHFYKK